MRLLSKDLMRKGTIIISRKKDIQKGQATIEFHGKLNEVRLIIKMLEENV